MNLNKAILRPATVASIVNDYNVIKVYAPGIFANGSNIEDLPPVYPLLETNSNSFAKLAVGDLVWLLSMEDNPQELFWVRRPEYTFGMEGEDMSKDGLEVVMRRPSGAGWAEIMFSNGDGLIMQNGGSNIQLKQDGSISIHYDAPKSDIVINGKGIQLGSDAHPAARGDKTIEAMQFIKQFLIALGVAATANPYTMPLSGAINKYIQQFDDNIKEIESPIVFLE